MRTLAAIAARDLRTVTGSNIRTIEVATGGLSAWESSPDAVRAAVTAAETAPVPECDAWRLPYLGKLLEERQRLHYRATDTKDVQTLIESLCV